MQSAFRALFVAWVLLSASAVGAQQVQGSSADGTAGAAQAKPATQKPNRPSMFDLIKTVVPPLIDAATKPKEATPQTSAEPAAAPEAEPLALQVPAESFAQPPTAVTSAVVTTPPPPPIEVPRAPPSEALPAQSSVARQLPPNTSRTNETPPSAPGKPAKAEPRPSLDVPPTAAAEPVRTRATEPPADVAPAVVLPEPAVDSGKTSWLLLGLLALAAVAAVVLMRLNRLRQVARTRSLLSLGARLELAPARSPSAVQASLIPEAAHG